MDILDNSGSVVAKYKYDAWGNTASNVSTLVFNQNATVLVGKAAAQGALSGGGIQWFVGNLSWLALL